MRCEDLFTALVEYVDGQIDPETAAAIERHLEECPVCRLVVDNIRKTIFVYSADSTCDMPETFHEHLDGLLRDHWKARFPSSQPEDAS
ncbi:MAG: zf-HC2 domain-containing protein [Pirellulales bacterium]|nr:zf-HC2 domain-containing protein [Pirellulales bacterium]